MIFTSSPKNSCMRSRNGWVMIVKNEDDFWAKCVIRQLYLAAAAGWTKQAMPSTTAQVIAITFFITFLPET